MQNKPRIIFRDQDEHVVFMSNRLIRNPKIPWGKLSTHELKLLRYFISLIPQKCELQTLYTVCIKDFIMACGETPAGKNYKKVKDAFESLADCENYKKWIHLENDDRWHFAFLNDARINPRTRKMTFRFSEYMYNLLAELKEHFTAYQICYILSMVSKYSIIMYELLLSYASLHGHRFDVADLKEMLGAERYKNFKDFRNRCLDIACKEINEKTDICISYTPVKNGRAVSAVDFSIRKKSYDELLVLWGYKDNAQQIEESSNRPATNEDDDQIPGQISLAI